ncbi:MAG: hypothetical protein FD163_983 [Hyphomonadaceae bacterium]|nr:MAG: hypothetical protein FD163_983 [Hyphomonadaceae bacterium]
MALKLHFELQSKKWLVAVVISLIATLLFQFPTAFAQSRSYSPRPGSAERRELLNLLRPIIARDLGAPIEFVVNEIKVSGYYAFVSVDAQRPGGRRIDPAKTKWAGRHYPDIIDCCHAQAIYQKRGNRWRILESALGATDVWYLSYCGRVPSDLYIGCPTN